MDIKHELNHLNNPEHQYSDSELRLKVYNELSDLMFQYHNEGIDVPKKDMEKALNWFLEKFYEV